MDALDKYKKAWDNQPKETNKVSKVDIYKMAQSKSSSIVKWIFIIGLLELIIPLSMYLFFDLDKLDDTYAKLGLANYAFYSQIILYPVVLVFLFLFYKNYKNIYTTDTTKELMQKILKTRKTVRNYIFLNLGYAFITLIVVVFATIKTQFNNLGTKEIIITSLVSIAFGILLIGCIWLIYQLLYGILLRKLNKNYKELAKLDSPN
ncbi:hypothetical protein DS884_00580 [Tenacibaculum sp. E3R01]|uniref:hypothetical protein n=1 Tax=unclassified Tenacibaculum TaxID=2635139 RepID=UPI0008951F86|nr:MULTISPECIES: hypothetical protein [unclassified Tenacibaculum]RBW63200.1 hypothetical protein DS884_00580 [Tenacibaculum sp. E3R01]SEE44414.1 hypothetical protein SAMN04487765_2598 [Tenacibaculum sp. MAR_2010_89]